MQHVGGVEEDLFDALALLAAEAHDAVAAAVAGARPFTRPLEVAAAPAAPAVRQVVVHLRIGADGDGALDGSAGARGGREAKARAAPSPERHRDHRGHQHRHEEKGQHAPPPPSVRSHTTATSVLSSITNMSTAPTAKVMVRCGCAPRM